MSHHCSPASLQARPLPSSGVHLSVCPVSVTLVYCVESSGGSRPGPGGLGLLTFCPGSPIFPPTTYYCPPPLGARGPAPRVFWLEPPLVERSKHILKLFFTVWYPHPVLFQLNTTHTILVFFLYQTLWRYSDGNPLTGATNAR